jgi:hypothetical protein
MEHAIAAERITSAGPGVRGGPATASVLVISSASSQEPQAPRLLWLGTDLVKRRVVRFCVNGLNENWFVRTDQD